MRAKLPTRKQWAQPTGPRSFARPARAAAIGASGSTARCYLIGLLDSSPRDFRRSHGGKRSSEPHQWIVELWRSPEQVEKILIVRV